MAGILIMLTSPSSSASDGKTNAPSGEFLNEGVSVFRQYLSIDTTNPPGNEMRTALFLKKILDAEGIENRIIDLGGNRANLYAIIRGDGSQKPVIMLHHMDVVPADAGFWKHPPFSAQIDNGIIYARGAIDMKAKGIIDLMSMIYIKRNSIPLKRDLILLAVSDEEDKSAGSRTMVKDYPELIKNAEYLLDEGGSLSCDKNGKITGGTISIGEKTPLWLTLTFRGEPGHGSIPTPDSSVSKAIKAAWNILNRKPEYIVLPELIDMLADITDPENLKKQAGWKGNLPDSLKNPDFLAQLSEDTELNAYIANTVTITMLKGSSKINTIPNEASIGLDCRLMPGSDKEAFIQKIKQITGDPQVKITVEEYYPTFYSPADSLMVKTIQKCVKKTEPDIRVIPVLLLSSTDSSFYRSLGIKCYGFEPYKAMPCEYNSSHGNDERIGVENFKYGISLMLEILQEINR
jgi:acetylornithine deacetylase/succinyl-diaminopimelate desuccinylase-like protein